MNKHQIMPRFTLFTEGLGLLFPSDITEQELYTYGYVFTSTKYADPPGCSPVNAIEIYLHAAYHRDVRGIERSKAFKAWNENQIHCTFSTWDYLQAQDGYVPGQVTPTCKKTRSPVLLTADVYAFGGGIGIAQALFALIAWHQIDTQCNQVLSELEGAGNDRP